MLEPLLALNLILFAFTTISAVVARSAARDARSEFRKIVTDTESLFLQVSALSAAIRRVEGRQTGLMRGPARTLTASGLPDPQIDPEAWRAAVRARAANAIKQ
jgi:hypothetical protein